MSAHDFDFLHGDWVVHNRRLRGRLEGSLDWEEFTTRAHVRPALGGIGNVEDITHEGGVALGLTVRAFDVAEQRWHIHWVGARDGVMQPAMVGTFAGMVGTFFADDHHEGRPCRCRFLWRVQGPDRATWEQALSVDDGQIWETNWTMAFTRRDVTA